MGPAFFFGLEVLEVLVVQRDDVLWPGAAAWQDPTLALDFPADLPYTPPINVLS